MAIPSARWRPARGACSMRLTSLCCLRWTGCPFPSGAGKETLAALAKLAPDAAALIVEPLLLGAGGMLTYAPEILAAMKKLCEKHGTLFIADEVLTGFGRTGTLFACEQAGITPDILCLAKGLSGGALLPWRRPWPRKRSSTRIIHRIAPARFSITVLSPPIPSPAPPPAPISPSGRRSLCATASPPWPAGNRNVWPGSGKISASRAYAISAPLPPWTWNVT